jgi:hypothetical protein
MSKKINLGKISIVVFLTALIWVWADLAQDERLTLTDVVVEVAKSSNATLWVSFTPEQGRPDLQTAVTLDTVVLKGPASQKAEVERMSRKGLLKPNVFLVPEREGFTQTGVRTLDVLDLLTRSEDLRKLGLTVESCEPKTLTVRIQELVRASVPVECVGLDASVQATLMPDAVEAFVPKDEVGIRKAAIRLTPEDQAQARNSPVEKTPYLELAPGQRREVLTKVQVTLAPAQNVLASHRVSAIVGFCFNQNMQGKYRVIVENDPTELGSVEIRATSDAHQAYAQAQYQIILPIKDSDRQATELPIRREVVFDFPEEYLRKNEIRADRPPPVARFRLEPIAETNTESKL